ncbi:hypothetical protein D3C78_1187610 [compost metagenome]
MQLLRVGSIAQELPQAGGLGSSTAEQIDKTRLVEVHQFSYRYRGGQCANGRGGVESAVVGASQELTDTNTRLVTSNGCQEQFATRFAKVLSCSQHSRENNGSRVQHGAIV